MHDTLLSPQNHRRSKTPVAEKYAKDVGLDEQTTVQGTRTLDNKKTTRRFDADPFPPEGTKNFRRASCTTPSFFINWPSSSRGGAAIDRNFPRKVIRREKKKKKKICQNCERASMNVGAKLANVDDVLTPATVSRRRAMPDHKPRSSRRTSPAAGPESERRSPRFLPRRQISPRRAEARRPEGHENRTVLPTSSARSAPRACEPDAHRNPGEGIYGKDLRVGGGRNQSAFPFHPERDAGGPRRAGLGRARRGQCSWRCTRSCFRRRIRPHRDFGERTRRYAKRRKIKSALT